MDHAITPNIRVQSFILLLASQIRGPYPNQHENKGFGFVVEAFFVTATIPGTGWRYSQRWLHRIFPSLGYPARVKLFIISRTYGIGPPMEIAYRPLRPYLGEKFSTRDVGEGSITGLLGSLVSELKPVSICIVFNNSRTRAGSHRHWLYWLNPYVEWVAV